MLATPLELRWTLAAVYWSLVSKLICLFSPWQPCDWLHTISLSTSASCWNAQVGSYCWWDWFIHVSTVFFDVSQSLFVTEWCDRWNSSSNSISSSSSMTAFSNSRRFWIRRCFSSSLTKASSARYSASIFRLLMLLLDRLEPVMDWTPFTDFWHTRSTSASLGGGIAEFPPSRQIIDILCHPALGQVLIFCRFCSTISIPIFSTSEHHICRLFTPRTRLSGSKDHIFRQLYL